ncbi:uncharacterized protein LOC111361769 isoform X1 [Spodoptera litura]|uniref:Uncharacterized protein LOC111361769 isoform X1 n=1 Tax=Spodoptera litura TaxID=69820 RepID=A0A9J7IYF5_SPOLT|nr:uncharacterized protein LOC111361769 isoform X1 [Spodoptera litura]
MAVIPLRTTRLYLNMKPKNKAKSSRIISKDIRRRKTYNSENLNKALQAVKEGMSKKLAAKTYQVPRATLQYRIKNPEHQSRPGPPTILTEKEEKDLEDWILFSCRKGFPKRKHDLISSVSNFLNNSNRGSVFKNGEKWYKLFLQRHPNISVRTPEAVTAASAAVSENDVRGWFSQIEDYLKENDLFDILEDSSRVFNGDETNFLLCPKTGIVLAPKGEKNVYEIDNALAKTSLTVMFTFCAHGDLTPPMVIFPNKRLSADITSKVPSNWGIGLSDNGWMKAEVFHDYIESVLHPHLIKKGTKFPIILFVDGHKTHLTFAVSELCKKLEIVLIALYPNCTRLLQPADVSAFKPLKSGWQKTVLEWRRNNPSVALTKNNFVPLLDKTIKNTISASTVINGFRATGICPWNVNAVDYTKCLRKANIPLTETFNKKINENPKVMTKEDFRNIIGASKMSQIEGGALKPEESYLQKLWNFFTEVQKDSTHLNKDNTSNEQDVDITLDTMDIENMPVILNEYLTEELSDCAPTPTSEIIVTAEDFNNGNDDRSWGNSQEVLHVTHKAEVHEATTRNTKISILSQQIEHPTKTDAQQQNSEFEKIETYIDPAPVKIQKPSTVMLNLTPIKLTDVLVLPKSPQRKGVRNIKRAPFVLTSEKWRSIESEKLRIKQEKEEGIKKRKEEREKKKLESKTKQTKQKVTAAKMKIAKEHKRVNADVKKIVPPEKLDTADISWIPPANVDCTPIENQEDKENYIDNACLVPENNNNKQIKIVYTDAEIEKFLTEFDSSDV